MIRPLGRTISLYCSTVVIVVTGIFYSDVVGVVGRYEEALLKSEEILIWR